MAISYIESMGGFYFGLIQQPMQSVNHFLSERFLVFVGTQRTTALDNIFNVKHTK